MTFGNRSSQGSLEAEKAPALPELGVARVGVRSRFFAISFFSHIKFALFI